MKCILLVRVSTEKQSYESQEKEIRELAIKDGYKEKEITSVAFKESGRKLTEEERLGLNEMKRLIEKGGYNCVYAWEISRIARTKKVLFSIAEYLQKRKIQLVIKEPSIRLLKNNGEIDEGAETIFTLYAQLAESEMRNKMDRFTRGKRQKAKEGRYVGGNLAFGYCINEEKNKLIEIDEKESEIVKLIFNLYEKGVTQPNMPIELEKRGVFNIKISLINHILNNRHYIGELYKKKDTKIQKHNERIYPPIISKEQFERCREIAKNNNTRASKARNIYFAENLVYCKSCNCKWSASGSKVSYHCYNAYKSKKLYEYEYTKKPQCKNKLSMSINVLDSLLFHIATIEDANALLSANKTKITEAEKEINEIHIKRKNITKRLEDLEQKRKRFNNVYINGEIDENDYLKMKSKHVKMLNEIKAEDLRYKTEEERLKKFIEQVKKDLAMSVRYRNYSNYLDELQKLEDEQQMYDLVHKHITSVSVEAVDFIHTFAIGEKKTKAKRIKVQTITRELRKLSPLEYIYIPFDGRGGITMLRKYINADNQPYYENVFYRYLKRFEDKGKIKLKEERRKKRENNNKEKEKK